MRQYTTDTTRTADMLGIIGRAILYTVAILCGLATVAVAVAMVVV